MDAQDEEYELKGPDAEGKGVFTDKGFLVKAGSLARREIVPSGKSVTSVHQRLISEGVLEEHGGQLRFTKDHLFNSPSGAAAAVLGQNCERVDFVEAGRWSNTQQGQTCITGRPDSAA